MKASYVTLILNSTGGYFDKADVPSLYVEIQNHRAELERSLSRQLTFHDALFSWMENIFSPIMNEILSSLKLKLITSQKSISKVYFELYEKAEETDFRNLDETIESYIQENEVSVFRFMFSLFHPKKRAAVEEIAI